MESQRKDDFESVLDQSLERIRTGQATVEQCLAGHPAWAAELRPLLELARDLQQAPRPQASAAAYNAGRRRMLAAIPPSRGVAPQGRTGRWARWLGAWSGSLSGRRLAWATSAVLLVVLLAFGWSGWQAGTVSRTAALIEVVGAVELLPVGQISWQRGDSGSILTPGGRLRTGEASVATLRFADGSTTVLGAGTELTAVTLRSRRDGAGSVVQLYQERGETYNQVRRLPSRPSRFDVETANALTQVHGTSFSVRVDEDQVTYVSVTEGLVAVTAGEVTRQLSAGERTSVQPGLPPAQPVSTPALPATQQPTGDAAPARQVSPEQAKASATPLRASTPQPSNTPQRPGETPQGESNTAQPPSETPQGPSHTPRHPSETPRASHTPQRPSETPRQPNHTPQRPSETPRQPTDAPRQPSNTPRATHTPQRPSETPRQPSHTPQQPSETPRQPSHTPQQPSETPRQPSNTPQQPSNTPRLGDTPGQPNQTPQRPSETPRQPSNTPGQPGETPGAGGTAQRPTHTPRP